MFWHTHANADELFIVTLGKLKILFRDGEVVLGPGECFVVPRGTEHKPIADEEVHCLLVELAGTLNTGNEGGYRTIFHEDWL